MIEVEVRGDLEYAIRQLKKKLQIDGIKRELKRREFYEKPSVRKRRKAAEAREEMRRKRVAMGLPADPEVPESQVGNRRYARGRAYVADRYTNPETAEERTRLAAEASEGEAPIDESVPDDVDLIPAEPAEAAGEPALIAEQAGEASEDDPWEAEADEEPWDDEDDKSDAD